MARNKNPSGAEEHGGARGRVDLLGSACGGIAMLGVAVITVICVAVQFLRTDLDWITTPMSLYALGPWGNWVRASFFAPAPGMVLIGVGWYRTLDEGAGSLAALALFIAAGVALCFTGAFLTDTTPHPVSLHGTIHQWAAFGTFVTVTAAMTLQSCLFRLDRHWCRHFPEALTIAVIAIVYFWIYALFHPIPRGLGEKVVIGLVLWWLWRAGWWLLRARLPWVRRGR